MTRRRSLLSLAVAILPALACSEGPGPTEPSPVSGVLRIHLTTAHTDDRALLLRVVGADPPGAVLAVPSGVVAHMRIDSTGEGASRRYEARVALFGALGDGDLLTVAIPDIAHAATWAAEIIEGAGPAAVLRGPGDYGLTLDVDAPLSD